MKMELFRSFTTFILLTNISWTCKALPAMPCTSEFTSVLGSYHISDIVNRCIYYVCVGDRIEQILYCPPGLETRWRSYGGGNLCIVPTQRCNTSVSFEDNLVMTTQRFIPTTSNNNPRIITSTETTTSATTTHPSTTTSSTSTTSTTASPTTTTATVAAAAERRIAQNEERVLTSRRDSSDFISNKESDIPSFETNSIQDRSRISERPSQNCKAVARQAILGGDVTSFKGHASCDRNCVLNTSCVAYDYDIYSDTCTFHTDNTACDMKIATNSTLHCTFTSCSSDKVAFLRTKAEGGTLVPARDIDTCLRACEKAGPNNCAAVDFQHSIFACYIHSVKTCQKRVYRFDTTHIQVHSCPFD